MAYIVVSVILPKGQTSCGNHRIWSCLEDTPRGPHPGYESSGNGQTIERELAVQLQIMIKAVVFVKKFFPGIDRDIRC